MTLITRMVLLANQHGETFHLTTEGWTAQPVTVCKLLPFDYSDLIPKYAA
jgi:hypothetical protein